MCEGGRGGSLINVGDIDTCSLAIRGVPGSSNSSHLRAMFASVTNDG